MPIISLVLTGLGCSPPEELEDPSPSPSLMPEPSPTASPTPLPTPAEGLLALSDGGNFKVDFIRPDSGAVVYRLDVSALYPDCGDGNGACVLTEIHHSVHQGHDYLDMNLAQLEPTDAEGPPTQPATLRRVRLSDPPQPVYTLRELDFSQLPGGDAICDYDPSQPCGTGTTPYCNLAFPHDLDILVDDPDQEHVEVMVADLATQRILKVNFDYAGGNTCGQVEWVLNSQTDDFPGLGLPNDADYLEAQGTPYLLTGFYSAEVVVGAGQLTLWKRPDPDGPWLEVWTYPDPNAGELSNLNTPHAPLLFTDPDGGLRLRYAHSRGEGQFWRVGYEGTLGLARLESLESPPAYILEEEFPEGNSLAPLGFVRDVEQVPDGRFLVTDSGCEIPVDCPLPGRLYLMRLASSQVSAGLSGAWTSSRSQQKIQALVMPQVTAFDCGFSTTYEADFLPRAGLGEELAGRWDQEVAQCLPVAGEE